jgi:hypothetical protein
MLTEGENQRKLETAKCEEFTRCRVEKNKIRSSCYEYIDIDTSLRISGEDYTQRYSHLISSLHLSSPLFSSASLHSSLLSLPLLHSPLLSSLLC